jgi:hypothetical protein
VVGLIYPGTAREAIGELSEEERTAVMSEYRALGQESGVFGSEQLHPADTAISVRVEDGRTLTTDGAFANEDIGVWGAKTRCASQEIRDLQPGR